MSQTAVVKQPDTIQSLPRENNGDSLDGLRCGNTVVTDSAFTAAVGESYIRQRYDYSPHAKSATIFRLVCIVFRSDTVEASW